ncbi:MAG: DegT/DnrJ/EryC1/StrS family aminotransferase [Geminicoccaceae bacterium]
MIPLLDLEAGHRQLVPKLEAAFARVLQSGRFVLGPEVEAFEAEFARYTGSRFAVGVNSGTSALHLALLAAGVGPGDEVITTPMTFVATVAAILYTGARPVFVDIDPERHTIDPAMVARAIGPRTKAILPVHLHGGMADMEALMALADEHGLAVIEDAAQAHGAEFRGRRAGSIGDLGCFSFYPGKNLGAVGEAGAVVTDDAEMAAKLSCLRDWGQTEKYVHALKGYNYRMEALQGACLRAKLPYLERWTEARRAHAARYDRLLAGTGIVVPRAVPGLRHVYHVYAVQLAERDAVRRRLADAGIGLGIHYPVPVHLQPAYADLGYRPGDFPIAERFAAGTLSLPMYPQLSAEQISTVVDALCAVAAAA